MCLLISLFSYYIFRHYLQNTLIQSTETSLRLLSESMDNSMDEVYRLVRYCQTDSNIANYIEHNPNPGSVLSVSTYDSFYEECSRNSSYNYMLYAQNCHCLTGALSAGGNRNVLFYRRSCNADSGASLL